MNFLDKAKVLAEGAKLPSRGYHATTLNQLRSLMKAGWKAKRLFVKEDEQDIEAYLEMAAERERTPSDGVVIVFNMKKLKDIATYESGSGAGFEDEDDQGYSGEWSLTGGVKPGVVEVRIYRPDGVEVIPLNKIDNIKI